GKCLGTIGHLGCLSFHETKNIISGEGGALLVNDERFTRRAEIIREKGTDRARFFRGEVDKYSWVDIGSSYLPSELIGAFLYAQMEQAEKIIARRRMLFTAYRDALEPLERRGYVRLPVGGDKGSSNGHIFSILTGSLDERTRLIAHLRSKGIHAVFHYVPLHSSPAGTRFGRTAGSMEVTDSISDRLLRLPLYYEMDDDTVHLVADEVRRFYQGQG
ncbi:MAG TPA: DegT/DnrJ/EryC1/StrS family aminotransferase, partial [Desulfomonilia bacterium]|nr:DegT/DnrJ/EryC1/StrS family aminotransferase [Desulfomonilia bacterium]